MRLLWLLLTCWIGSCAAKANLYKTLGVTKDCSASELKKAYRRKCLKHHPDKVSPDQREAAERKFKEISEAYNILSDKDKRALYDQYGDAAFDPQFTPYSSTQQRMPSDVFSFFSQPQQQGGTQSTWQSQTFSFGSYAGGPSHLDLNEIIRQMMQGENLGASFSQARPPPKRQSYTRTLFCSLEDLATGAKKRLKVTLPDGRDELYTIQLQPGWKSGTRIKFGPRRNGFPAMTFVVEEKPHAFLKRVGNHLVYKCSITERQAERGAKLSIPLPTGDMFVIQADGPIQEGHIMTVPNQGMPIGKSDKRGELRIHFTSRRNPSSNHA